MALTAFQRDVCRLLADNRIRTGESYVAGGAALNELLGTRRRSRDIDLFHDTKEALESSWQADRETLEQAGYEVRVVRDRSSFVEAAVRRAADAVIVQWSQDSAYRFFPLLRHEVLGLVLHPFDLATGKVLALVGRVEARDFVDTLACDREIQPFGYLAWAACGKDPGFSPLSILEHAAGSSRYSQAELSALDFDDAPPDAGELSRRWHIVLELSRKIVALLPASEAGRAVLTAEGSLFLGDPDELREALRNARLRYHEGRIGGAFPRIIR